MGTMGRLIAKIGKAKQAGDYSEADFVRSLELDPPAVTVNYGRAGGSKRREPPSEAVILGAGESNSKRARNAPQLP